MKDEIESIINRFIQIWIALKLEDENISDLVP
jgi:hypothetical protein